MCVCVWARGCPHHVYSIITKKEVRSSHFNIYNKSVSNKWNPCLGAAPRDRVARLPHDLEPDLVHAEEPQSQAREEPCGVRDRGEGRKEGGFVECWSGQGKSRVGSIEPKPPTRMDVCTLLLHTSHQPATTIPSHTHHTHHAPLSRTRQMTAIHRNTLATGVSGRCAARLPSPPPDAPATSSAAAAIRSCRGQSP